jgi:hypothetical protein
MIFNSRERHSARGDKVFFQRGHAVGVVACRDNQRPGIPFNFADLQD